MTQICTEGVNRELRCEFALLGYGDVCAMGRQIDPSWDG